MIVRWILAVVVLTSATHSMGAGQEFGGQDEKTGEAASQDQAPAEAALVDDEAAQKAAEAAQKAQQEAEEAQKKQQRLQKIQQAQFDRRPSAILEAWAKPEGEEDEEDEKKGESSPGASPLSGFVISGDMPPEEMMAMQGLAGVTSIVSTGEPDPFDEDLKDFQRNVTLGNWAEVKAFLASLEEDLAKPLYQRLLTVLKSPPPPTPGRNIQPFVRPYLEKHEVDFDDCLALIDAAPTELEKGPLSSLGAILKVALDQGRSLDALLERLRVELTRPEGQARLTRRQIAKLLFDAGQAVPAGEFLPRIEDAVGAGDHDALNLLTRFHLGLYAEDPKTQHLEDAWGVLQSSFATGEMKKVNREEALRLAVELAPKVREDLGKAWLEDSFTKHPERGMAIVAAIGKAVSQALETHFQDSAFRLKGLRLQSTAAEALLSAAPEQASSWREPLEILASNWLREALVSYQYDTSTSLGPTLQRDTYGNFFYFDGRYYGGRQTPITAIATGDLLEIRPGEAWLSKVADSWRPKFSALYAQLYLKVSEEDQAFPFIERLAPDQPDQAKELVDEFLRVWTQNHDPNTSRKRTNIYVYQYGYEQKAESIPLTRSKQERNLVELTELVRRLRELPIGDLNEELLAKAFTTCHSSAEVYRIEAIESVFGSLDALDPDTVAELAQRMRTNLTSVWREPAVQEQSKTRRRKKDIEAEVLRGYQVATSVVAQALESHADHWGLHLALASLAHDANNFGQELAQSTEFTPRRLAALKAFEGAADLYAASLDSMEVDDQSTKVYEHWFYASLGACDLQAVDQEQLPERSQPALIRQKILALPGEAAERHLEMFANTLFTRMSAVNPATKYRYLRGGFEIVGDHPHAHEARKVFDYYKDLVTEIQLETRIDGSDVIGEKPFGVFVNLVHTREIEREAGGFGKYLQNQNNAYMSYNYGRPTENYRDKFEEAARQILSKHFEVLSITFQSDKVNSRALPKYGWRMTPYAYLLLKVRGPEVDRLPPLKLDLDFLDTSGYAVLPIESPTLVLDAASPAESRPIENLALSQTLDERQAVDGKLVLEVKGTARGLLPDLEELLELAPEGFDITETDDQGLSVSQFDEASNENAIVSERTWLVTMRAQDGAEKLPEEFRFGAPKIVGAESLFQRYVDADLLSVDSVIGLERSYGESSRLWMIWVGAAIVLVLGGGLAWRRWGNPAAVADESGLRLPEEVTPFTVIGLLREIERRHALDSQSESELGAQIQHLERHYFQNGTTDELDLRSIAEGWLEKAR